MLNDTQKYLLNEQYEDRISPCIQEILISAKSQEAKEVVLYLILMATRGSLNAAQYANLVTEYLGDSKEQTWLTERLKHLNALFQPNNDDHLFVRFIIDKRFYPQKLDLTLEEWRTSCKELIIQEYRVKIQNEVKTLHPALYEKVSSNFIEESHKKVVAAQLSMSPA